MFFWYGKKEIDFIVQNAEGKLMPIEVKYQNQVDQKDFLPIIKAGFKEGIIISEDTAANFDNFYILPYYLWGILC